MKSSVSLERALAFQAEEVVYRYHRDSGSSLELAEDLFTETKRWLWACARRCEDEAAGKAVPPRLIISPDLQAIDSMWHCFLLFTREYSDFCHNFLGRFIHHVPLTRAELMRFEELRKQDPARALKERRAELRPQLEYLHDLLGPEVLRNWYRR